MTAVPLIDAPTIEDGASIPKLDKVAASRRTWPFSLDTIRPTIAHYSPDAKEALVTAFAWCIDPTHPVPMPDFAERVGSKGNTIYKLFTGKYLHPETKKPLQPSPGLIEKIQQFLALDRARNASGEKDLVQTPTLKRIVELCDLARESQTMCFLVGPSHIGKTTALQKFYTPKNNHGRTIYTRMAAASRLGGMVKAMARSVGLSERGGNDELVERIENAVTGDMLWCLDELHLLAHTYRKNSFHNCMEVIRQVHDKRQIGMVLCFTILDEVAAASKKELQQIWRRGVHKLILPTMPTIEDLTAILNHHGLDFPEANLKVDIRYKGEGGKAATITETPREILHQVAKNEALLAITERLRYARVLAKKRGDTLDWKHFVEAHLIVAKQAQPQEEWK